MLKEMILINSAEFDYARIDLSRDMFFTGDNGTGKTSTIIALFYLFSWSTDSRKLGISSDKKSFKEYYFPDERNSFLIYVFDEFFNQTFNVDKSIVDAHSIKRAIQKSLNVEEKNIEFNYENYMSEVKGFQEAYLFFQKFEKESKSIKSAFRFQDELLEVEKDLDSNALSTEC